MIISQELLDRPPAEGVALVELEHNPIARERKHLSGDTVPACALNKFGRFLHRLSTLQGERPTPEQYYADQPQTVIGGLSRVCSSRDRKLEDRESISDGFKDFGRNFKENLRALFRRNPDEAQPPSE